MTKSSLPKGWRSVKFGDVVDNMNETTRDPEAIGLDRVVGLDHMDPESLPLKRWDNFSDLHEGTSFTRVFRAGQVLFGKRRAYQRKVSLPDFDGICSGDILVFQPKNAELLPEFLPYLVQSDGFFDHALGTSAGSLSPRTKWQELAKYEVSLPPIVEQRRICSLVSTLDQATAAYDEARFDLLVKSMFQELVLCADDTWPGGTLGEFCEIYQPQTISKTEMTVDGQYLVYGANGPIGRYGRFNHSEPEVVVTCRGATCGVVNKTTENCWITGNAMVIKPRDGRLLKDFLFWWLQFAVDVSSTISGSAQPQITRASLSPKSVRIPPLDRQRKLLEVIHQLEMVETKCKRVVSDLDSLRSSIINASPTGDLKHV